MPKDLTSIQKFWQLKKRLPQPFETASFFVSTLSKTLMALVKTRIGVVKFVAI